MLQPGGRGGRLQGAQRAVGAQRHGLRAAGAAGQRAHGIAGGADAHAGEDGEVGGAQACERPHRRPHQHLLPVGGEQRC